MRPRTLFQALVQCALVFALGATAFITSTQVATQQTASAVATATSVTRGHDHGCFIDGSNNAYCWGQNTNGQIGDGTTTARPRPTLVGGSLSWASISAGYSQTCGITTANALYCWGSNTFGRLGDTTQTQRTSPTLIKSGTSFSQVSTGVLHTCAVTTGNALWCWGYNAYGQIGIGSVVTPQATPVQVAAGTSWARVNAGGSFATASGSRSSTCAVTTAGAMWCWGYNGSGQLGDATVVQKTSPTAVAGGITFSTASIALGSDHACGIRASDSAAYCWGLNDRGQVGNNTKTNSTSPVAATGALSFTQISAGNATTCALQTTTNKQYCWGEGTGGVQGDGLASTDLVPALATGNTAWTSVSLAPDGACGLRSDALAYCWGMGTTNAIGDGTTVTQYSPRAVAMGAQRYAFPKADIAANESAATIAVTIERQGDITGAVSVDYATSNGTATAGTDYTSTSGTANFADSVTTATVNVPVNNDALSNGARTFTLTLSNPSVGTSLESISAVVVHINDDETAVPVVATGFNSSCLAASSAGGSLQCWGNGSYVGDGGSTQRLSPVSVGAGLNFTTVSVGYITACGVTSNYDAYCWGYNGNGQVGDGTNTFAYSPVLVGGNRAWASVTPGPYSTCGLTLSGDGYCWGYGAWGANGDNSANDRAFPSGLYGGLQFSKLAPAQDLSAASGSRGVACGLTTTSLVYCWGYNNSSQLGDGTTVTKYVPTPTSGGFTYSDVATASDSACAIRISNGFTYCWGYNVEGVVGDGTQTNRTTPTLTSGGDQFVSLTATNRATCGILSGGSLKCWGSGEFGAQGDGTASMRLTPTAVANGYTWLQLDGGTTGFCGITTSTKRAYCWGLNRLGTTGDGSVVTRYTPRPVSLGAITYGFALTKSGANESAGNATVTVERLGSASGAVSVDYATSNGTASAGTDYTSTTGTLNFADGVTTATITVPITNDALSNGERTFSLTLSNPSGGTGLDARTTVPVQIHDDESGHRFVSAGPVGSCTLASTAGSPAYCTGENNYSQLGNGTSVDSTTPVAASGGLSFVSISNGRYSTCGITVDYQLYCWGYNSNGTVGSGSSTSILNTPQLVAGGLAWNFVDAGSDTACGVTVDNLGFCWGIGSYGVIGDNNQIDRATPNGVYSNQLWSTIELASDASNAGAARKYACGLTTTGSSYCWGYNNYSQIGDGSATQRLLPTATSLGYTYSDIDVSRDAACGIRISNGFAYCWGWNGEGQVGDNTQTTRTTPVVVSGGDVFTSITSGGNQFCGLLAGGSAKCWGSGYWGAQGDKTAMNRWTPTATLSGYSWRSLSATALGACGVTTSELVYCWGANNIGQYGNGQTVSRYYPRAMSVGASRFTFSLLQTGVNEATGTIGVAVDRTGSSSGAVSVDYASSNGTASAGTDYTSASGTLNFADTVTTQTITVPINNDALANGDRTFTLTLSNPSGGTSLEQQTSIVVVIRDDESAKRQVSAGPLTTCTIASTAGSAAYCSGDSGYYQTGNGSTTQVNTPTAVSGGLMFTKVAVGRYNGCGIAVDFRMYCWGYAGNGETGTGTSTTLTTPTLVAGGLAWKTVDIGQNNLCATTVDDMGYCWGTNSYNANGDGTAYDRIVPHGVQLNATWTKITPVSEDSNVSAGRLYTCGLTTSGAAYCWGGNAQGQLGDNTTVNKTVPTAVSGGYTFSDLDVGRDNTCGIRISDSYVYCWGYNAEGGVGDNTSTTRLVPTLTSGNIAMSSLAGGGTHFCGLSGSTMYCWGGTDSGALADTTNTMRKVPAVSASGFSWQSISGSSKRSCGVTTANLLYCVGNNAYGQNGDNTVISRFAMRGASLSSSRFTLQRSSVTVNELAGTASVVVDRVGDTTGAVSVGYATVNGTASSGTDYTSTSGTLNIASGQATGTVTVPILNNTVTNGLRSFTLTLSGPSGGTSFDTNAVTTVTVTINDDDSATPKVVSGKNSCYLASTAGSTASCWGYNTDGQIGDNTSVAKNVPTAVSGGLGFREIDAGMWTNCGITINNELYCWGNGGFGQVGIDSAITANRVPVLVAGDLQWRTVSVGHRYACGITVDNAGYCWGSNGNGEIGDGTQIMRTVPTGVAVPAGSSYWVSLQAGGDPNTGQTACGITNTGAGYCWGYNAGGQIGDNTTVAKLVPTSINGSYTWASLTRGGTTTCGITTGNTLYCWGKNANGEVGDNSIVQRNVPTLTTVGGNTYSSVKVDYLHVCGVTTANDMYCWGDNPSGQIGDNTTAVDRLTPTVVNTSKKWRTTEAGYLTTCGMTTGNILYCWGDNTNGDLGIGASGQLQPTTALYTPGPAVTVAASASITEGDAGFSTLNVGLTLNTTAAQAVVVQYRTTDATAVSPFDYTGTQTGSAFVAAGATSGNVQIPIVGDTNMEADETFGITITGVSYNANFVGTLSSTETILNNDAFSPYLTFTVTGATAGTTCNGVTSSDTSLATAFSLHPTLGVNGSTVMNTQVDTNAPNGYTVTARMVSPLSNGTHTYVDHPGTNANPTSAFAPGTEAYGYSSGDTSLNNVGAGTNRFAGSKFAGLTGTETVQYGAGAANETACQVFQSSQSSTTPTGSYAGSLVLTVIPNF